MIRKSPSFAASAKPLAQSLHSSVTMKHIAERAGVSVPTVSRALVGSDRVAAITRMRVEEAASALGYKLNQRARSLRTQRTMLVVAVVPDIGNTFFSYVLAGIEQEAVRLGYSVLIGNVANDPRRAKRYGDHLLAGTADGVILLTGQLPEPNWAERMKAAHLPIVALCERIVGHDLTTVAIDDRKAARQVTEHLLALGHRTIGHVTAPTGTVLANDRRTGFTDALAAAGLNPDVSLIAEGDFTIDGGFRAFDQIYARHPDITAVFCANDETAMGVINAMRVRALEAPGDIAVAGFDGLEFGAAFYPPITTVAQPRLDLGATAMRLLHEHILSPDAPRRQITLEAELIVRASTFADRPILNRRPNAR